MAAPMHVGCIQALGRYWELGRLRPLPSLQPEWQEKQQLSKRKREFAAAVNAANVWSRAADAPSPANPQAPALQPLSTASMKRATLIAGPKGNVNQLGLRSHPPRPATAGRRWGGCTRRGAGRANGDRLAWQFSMLRVQEGEKEAGEDELQQQPQPLISWRRSQLSGP
jgi:hypothetical protein